MRLVTQLAVKITSNCCTRWGSLVAPGHTTMEEKGLEDVVVEKDTGQGPGTDDNNNED